MSKWHIGYFYVQIYFIIKEEFMLKKYFKTMEMSARNQTNGGILYMLPSFAIRLVYIFPLMILWRTLIDSGVDAGMTLTQMLTYTLIGNLFRDLLNVETQFTDWIMDSPLVTISKRPMTIYGYVAAESLGKAIPGLLFFTIPMLIISPLLGVNTVPMSLWVFPSLVLCISLGFAVEFIFAALLVRMINTSWLIHSIRNAIIWLFSGAVIPFAILPFGLDEIMKYQPFGSLAGAPLSIYAGISEPIETIIIQIVWNLILWPFAVMVFNKSRERMVSHGG